MRFSQRIGRTPVKNQIQLGSMDQDLRYGLWNEFTSMQIRAMTEESFARYRSTLKPGPIASVFAESLWHEHYKLPIDVIPDNLNKIIDIIRSKYMEAPWWEFYDFLEFVARFPALGAPATFRERCNGVMERELSGYRFVGGQIAPITNATEIAEIDAAAQQPVAGVAEHVQQAVAYFSDRQHPDFRNSIKESISAVESVCQRIAGKNATLGQALKTVGEKLRLHPALEKGLSAIYGYTNDEGGIRHALNDESVPCENEDAKYMLVACSAFVNFLIAKAARAGIPLE